MFCIICIFVWWLYVRDCHDFVKFVDAWLHDQVLQSLDSCWQLPRAKFRDVTVGPFDHCRSSHPHQLFGKKRLLETVYNCWWNSVLHSILLQWWLKHLVHFILYSSFRRIITHHFFPSCRYLDLHLKVHVDHHHVHHHHHFHGAYNLDRALAA